LNTAGFTEAHLRGGRLFGAASSSLAVTVGELLRAGEPLIYAYYDGIDKIAHERGFGNYYNAELRAADDLVEQVTAQLTDWRGTAGTADHGQVAVGTDLRAPAAEVLKLTRYCRAKVASAGFTLGRVRPRSSWRSPWPSTATWRG